MVLILCIKSIILPKVAGNSPNKWYEEGLGCGVRVSTVGVNSEMHLLTMVHGGAKNRC